MKETDKQIEFIRFIERETGVIYTGSSKREAEVYISENKPKLDPSSMENNWSIINGY